MKDVTTLENSAYNWCFFPVFPDRDKESGIDSDDSGTETFNSTDNMSNLSANYAAALPLAVVPKASPVSLIHCFGNVACMCIDCFGNVACVCIDCFGNVACVCIDCSLNIEGKTWLSR